MGYLNFAHDSRKTWIFRELRGINLWNKKHFVGKDTDIAQCAFKCCNILIWYWRRIISKKKTCTYPCSFTYIVVEASSVWTEDRRKMSYKFVFEWLSWKQVWSTQSTTSHFTHLNMTICFTPLAEHMRHRRLVSLQPGQCLLWRVSSLPMLLESLAGLPTGMDGRGSCPAHASISLIRVSWKSLCEIFFPPHEDKRT